MNLNLMPKVIDKTLKKKDFQPNLIYESLLRETSLTEEEAGLITEQTTRCVITISGNVSHITAPMIREICNSVMLKHGFEIQRLENTRIGFPYFELKNLLENEPEDEDGDEEILEHVLTEFYNVKNLIKTIEKLNKRGKINGKNNRPKL